MQYSVNIMFAEASGVQSTYMDILEFFTGMQTPPPAGFSPKPSIIFTHQEDIQGPGIQGQLFLARANISKNQLRLPVSQAHRRYIDFQQALDMTFTAKKGVTQGELTHNESRSDESL